ncbi:MAG: TonB-dependent receptor [Opitutaceae bacterium]
MSCRSFPRHRLWLSLSLFPLACTRLLSQAAPVVPSAENSDPVLVLTPFTVTAEQERGYLAGNAISGTKTNTALRDLPISLSVITSEVLNDLNGTLPTDALNYSPSVAMTNAQTVGNIQGSPFNTGNTTVRGSGTFFTMRDGFRTYSEPASVGVQRIEVVKGPAAVLYGITKPGGIVNYITKTPEHDKTAGRATFTYGSYQSTRSTIDLNYGKLLNGRLAFRLNASYNDLATWFRFSKSSEKVIMPSVSYKPFPTTDILLQYDFSERIFPANSTDYFTRPVTGFRGSSVPFFVYPTGASDPVATLSPQLPAGLTPDFTFRGYASGTRVPYKTGIVAITQRLGDLTLHAQLSRSRRNNLRVAFAPTAQFTGSLTDTAAANTVLAAPRVRKQYESRDGYNELDNVNVTAIYQRSLRLPLLGDSQMKLIAGASRLEENFEAWRFREFRAGTTTRINWYFPLAPTSGTGLPEAFPFGVVQRDPSQNEAENNDFSLGYLAWSSELLNRRLIINAGVVRALFTQERQQGTAAGGYTGFSNPADQNSPLLGAIVRPFSWAGVYVQHSKSFNPNTSARDGFGNPLAPEQGDGYEIGLKLDPWGGKLTANFAVYETVEKSRLISDPNAPNSNSFYLDANGNPQPLSGPDDSRYNPNLAGQQKGANKTVGEATSEGFEVEVIWSPVKQVQVLAAYTYLDGYVSKDLNTSPATWEGRPLPNNYYHRAAALAKYRFTDGRLKGLDVVVGANWRSEIFRDAINATSDSTTTLVSPVARFGKPAWDGDFKLGYQTRIFGRRTTLQFNIKNLFGRELGVGWKPAADRTYAYEQFYYTVPKSYSFTVGFEL